MLQKMANVWVGRLTESKDGACPGDGSNNLKRDALSTGPHGDGIAEQANIYT